VGDNSGLLLAMESLPPFMHCGVEANVGECDVVGVLLQVKQGPVVRMCFRAMLSPIQAVSHQFNVCTRRLYPSVYGVTDYGGGAMIDNKPETAPTYMYIYLPRPSPRGSSWALP